MLKDYAARELVVLSHLAQYGAARRFDVVGGAHLGVEPLLKHNQAQGQGYRQHQHYHAVPALLRRDDADGHGRVDDLVVGGVGGLLNLRL